MEFRGQCLEVGSCHHIGSGNKLRFSDLVANALPQWFTFRAPRPWNKVIRLDLLTDVVPVRTKQECDSLRSLSNSHQGLLMCIEGLVPPSLPTSRTKYCKVVVYKHRTVVLPFLESRKAKMKVLAALISCSKGWTSGLHVLERPRSLAGPSEGPVMQVPPTWPNTWPLVLL